MISRRFFRSWIPGSAKVAESYPNGLFGIAGLSSPKDFPRISKERVEKCRILMSEWRDSPNVRCAEQDIELLDNVSNELCRIADAAEFIRNVHSHPDWIEGATKSVQAVSSFMNEANVDSKLFERAKNLAKNAQNHHKTDPEHVHVISAMVEAMEHEGVGLSGDKKARLVNLLEQDTVKSFEIVSSDTSDRGGGVWVKICSVTEKIQPWLNLMQKRTVNGHTEYLVPQAGNMAGLVPQLLKLVDDRDLREKLWKATLVSDTAKEDAMHQLVTIRRDLASIRGYSSWNDYAQRESILSPLGGPKAVEQFLADLWRDIGPGLEREMSALKSVGNFPASANIEPWDLDYLSARWKEENSASVASIQEIQKHLTFQRIIAGGQTVLRKVLDVDLQYDKSAGSLWHPDAMRLTLTHAGQENPFAHMYVDPYERESKSVQSAQFTIAGSKRFADGSRQMPQTALVLGLPRDPTIPLPINVAVTFFHELGHASHSLLSETRLQHFSGSRGAIDFVEFPSHLFEYFGTEPECLDEILGGQIHASYLEHYNENRNPFAHLEVAQQLTYAMLDQVYYATGSPTDLDKHLPDSSDVDKRAILQLLQPNSTASFEHLVHYGGSYYCYLLCRALAAQVWDRGFRGKPWGEAAGSRLKRFLKKGSVDQSLHAIYGIIEQSESAQHVSRKELLRDLSRCRTIHS
jgi:intermediate peptidase